MILLCFEILVARSWETISIKSVYWEKTEVGALLAFKEAIGAY